MNTAIKIKELCIDLNPHFRALDSITIDLEEGKIIGFIGPSGAGKTTLIRAIVGSLHITSGEIFVFGKPAGTKELRKQVSYMTQGLSIYPDLTVTENIIYFITMAGQPTNKAATILQEVLQLVDLTDKSNILVSELSAGQKQRVSLAVALIGSPKLLVLDEPTVGLDPVLRENLWQLFSTLAKKGITLIVSSHSMDEAERCDDLVLIRDGKLIAHNTPRKLLEQTHSITVEESFLKLVGTNK